MPQNQQEKFLLELFRSASQQERDIAIGMLLYCADRAKQEQDSAPA